MSAIKVSEKPDINDDDDMDAAWQEAGNVAGLNLDETGRVSRTEEESPMQNMLIRMAYFSETITDAIQAVAAQDAGRFLGDSTLRVAHFCRKVREFFNLQVPTWSGLFRRGWPTGETIGRRIGRRLDLGDLTFLVFPEEYPDGQMYHGRVTRDGDGLVGVDVQSDTEVMTPETAEMTTWRLLHDEFIRFSIRNHEAAMLRALRPVQVPQ